MIALSNGLLQVMPEQQIKSIERQLTTVSQASAVASLTPLIQQRTGLLLNDSRAIARRMIRLMKVQIRDNLAN